MNIYEILSKRKYEKERAQKKAHLMALIANAKNYLHTVGNGFDETTNDDLTEYYIYERRAAEIKYRHLLKLYIEEKFESSQLISNTPLLSESELINEA